MTSYEFRIREIRKVSPIALLVMALFLTSERKGLEKVYGDGGCVQVRGGRCLITAMTEGVVWWSREGELGIPCSADA